MTEPAISQTPGLAAHKGRRGQILVELKKAQPLTAQELAERIEVFWHSRGWLAFKTLLVERTRHTAEGAVKIDYDIRSNLGLNGMPPKCAAQQKSYIAVNRKQYQRRKCHRQIE